MKNVKNILLTILVVFSSTNLNAQSDKLVGKWVNEKLKITYFFKDDGGVIFEQGFASTYINSYDLDETKSPAWLDFTLKQGARSMVIPALIEFVDENTIKIEQFPPFAKHPVEFSKESDINYRNQHLLKRD